MWYLFHDVAYQNKTIRYVKPPDIDSDGFHIATNFAEMRVLSQYIEYREPATIVIALLGRGIIGCSNEDKIRGPILEAFQREYQRLPDKSYKWRAAELVID
ncbi:hypothetical protein [Hymenobacter bucti]|uniref:DUF695 domain-containing protein n=1 Tax=Hymenobacter bucti TaxID=1844114 RepID=A0ABW4QRV0_9BACT